MMNTITLIGRWTKDVELKYSANGLVIGDGHLAVNRPFSNQQGEKEADFIPITMFRKTAENTASYTKKGSQVALRGRLQSRRYENKEGRNVTAYEVVADEVVFLDKPDRSRDETEPRETGNDDPFDGSSVDDNQELPF